MKVNFYATVPDPDHFELVEFYRQDVDALRELGHEVRLCRRPRDLSESADLYWIWWQTSGLSAVLAAKARRRPSVLVTALSDRDLTPSGMNAKPPWTKAAAHVSLALADLVLPTSEDTRRGLERYRTKRMATGLLSVDTDRYALGDGEDEPPYALTISQLTPQNVVRKRLLDIVTMADRLRGEWPDLRFLIAGAMTDDIETVRDAIVRHDVQDRVTLVGRVTREEKIALLQRATIYLQPTRYEAFGQAIAEAMSCGKPVVTNAAGAVAEVVAEAGCVLPPDADTEALTQAILSLRDPVERRRLGAAARTRIEERFSRAMRLEVVRHAIETVS